MHHVFAMMALGELPPFVEIERLEAVRPFIHHFGVPHVQQGERPFHRADVDRLPETVQHQHIVVQ